MAAVRSLQTSLQTSGTTIAQFADMFPLSSFPPALPFNAPA